VNGRIVLLALVLLPAASATATRGVPCARWTVVAYTEAQITAPNNQTLREYFILFSQAADYEGVTVLTTSTLTPTELLAFAPQEACP
jgi:hypothetical protein